MNRFRGFIVTIRKWLKIPNPGEMRTYRANTWAYFHQTLGDGPVHITRGEVLILLGREKKASGFGTEIDGWNIFCPLNPKVNWISCWQLKEETEVVK